MSGSKNWYLYTMEYEAAERKKELPVFRTACMDLESIMLSEIIQTVRMGGVEEVVGRKMETTLLEQQ